ncbi:MAG: hypothetical protein ACPGEG_05705, partial [Salibacteraceae bacterium]
MNSCIKVRLKGLILLSVFTICSIGIRAATQTVSCSAAALITAINTANGNVDHDTITLSSACIYNFTSVDNYIYGPNALPVISSEITIIGNGATIYRNTSTKFRFFFVDTNGTLLIDDLTLKNGNTIGGTGGAGTQTSAGGGGGAGMGGAVFSKGNF